MARSRTAFREEGGCGVEAASSLLRDRGHGVDAGESDHGGGGHRLDERLVAVGADHDIAGQEQPDRAVGVQRLSGERGIACPEDQTGLHVVVELRLERGLDVDLGQDAEALLRQCTANGLHGLLEGPRQLDSVVVRH
ncbi:hypothetical protein ASE09_33620 [Streptomyces sp. Root66D1]|nr:hypothetical protein ASD33_33580 [Streptomyces sp. Root1304]KRA85573.1 hypothetical protein ASE09_33620 [Streptomyces sp. Root66D1]